jgi:hypothetical protein
VDWRDLETLPCRRCHRHGKQIQDEQRWLKGATKGAKVRGVAPSFLNAAAEVVCHFGVRKKRAKGLEPSTSSLGRLLVST